MKQIVFVAEVEDNRTDGDYKAFADRASAEKMAHYWLSHMTDRERNDRTVSVASYEIEVEDGRTVEEAYEDMLLDMPPMPDPLEWKEVK